MQNHTYEVHVDPIFHKVAHYGQVTVQRSIVQGRFFVLM